MSFRSVTQFIALSLVSGCLPLMAGLIVNLPNPTQFGSPGETVLFSGTLTNNGTDPIFLNGLSMSLDSPDGGLVGSSDIFFSEAPLSLGGGENTVMIPLFTVTINSPFAGQGYTGLFEIIGGSDETAQDIIASGAFSVQAAVPEPAFGPLAGALIGVCWLLRRRATSRVQQLE